MKRFLFLILVWLCALSLYAAQDVFVVNGTEVKDFTGQELVGKTVAKYRIETAAGKVIHYIDLAETEKIVVVDTRTKKELNSRGGVHGVSGTGKLNKPMVVIDGKTSTQEALGKLSPSEISNITVLKNESAVKKYGAEASNGVIVVVTKRAGESK
ncbi:MAG: TonB-dependent receptor plug domain-containing protein [Muribaculaceae bacterium]